MTPIQVWYSLIDNIIMPAIYRTKQMMPSQIQLFKTCFYVCILYIWALIITAALFYFEQAMPSQPSLPCPILLLKTTT